MNTRKIPNLCLNEIEWSQRAKNALAMANITTLAELASANGQSLASGQNVGAKTLREFIRACVSQCVVPAWIRDVKISIAITPDHLVDHAGWVRLSGPYIATERWLLELAIAQLGAVEWCVIDEGDGLVLCRDSRGYVEVEPEVWP